MFEIIAKRFPHLKNDLAQAGMNVDSKEYIKKAVIFSIIVTFVLLFVGFLVLSKLEANLIILLFLFPVLIFIIFGMFINSPRTKIKKKVNEIEREIVYAGRFLMIELGSDMPLYDAIINISKSFRYVGKYFKDIIDKAEIGKPLDVAINEVIESSPSESFRKLLWQVMNSLKTGADISVALGSVVEQISKEQVIKINTYNKKLNTFVVMYLLLGIIVPSLGIAMGSLLSTFMGFSLDFKSLIGVLIGILFLQIMFLSIIHKSRAGVVI